MKQDQTKEEVYKKINSNNFLDYELTSENEAKYIDELLNLYIVLDRTYKMQDENIQENQEAIVQLGQKAEEINGYIKEIETIRLDTALIKVQIISFANQYISPIGRVEKNIEELEQTLGMINESELPVPRDEKTANIFQRIRASFQERFNKEIRQKRIDENRLEALKKRRVDLIEKKEAAEVFPQDGLSYKNNEKIELTEEQKQIINALEIEGLKNNIECTDKEFKEDLNQQVSEISKNMIQERVRKIIELAEPVGKRYSIDFSKISSLDLNEIVRRMNSYKETAESGNKSIQEKRKDLEQYLKRKGRDVENIDEYVGQIKEQFSDLNGIMDEPTKRAIKVAILNNEAAKKRDEQLKKSKEGETHETIE